MAPAADHLGAGGGRAGAGLHDPLRAVPEPSGDAAFRRAALAGAHARLWAAAGSLARTGDGCGHAEDRAGRGVLPRGRDGQGPGQLRAQWRPFRDFQPRFHRRGRQGAGATHRGDAVRQPGGRPARCRFEEGLARRAAGSGPHRHAVRPEAGGATAGAGGRGARPAGHRAAGGGRPRLQVPPRHRPERHGARAVADGQVRRPRQAGRQHLDPAAGAQRPARHRQGADPHPQVQRGAVRADHGGALRQAHHPGGLPQPGVSGPARQPGDPRRGVGCRVLVRARPGLAQRRADRAADRAGEGAFVLRPAAQPGARDRAPQFRAGEDARNRPARRRGLCQGQGRAAGHHPRARHRRRQPLPGLRRPGPPPAGPRLPRGCAAGRRPERADRHVAVRAGLCRRRGDAHGQVAAGGQAAAAAGRPGADRRA